MEKLMVDITLKNRLKMYHKTDSKAKIDRAVGHIAKIKDKR